MAKPIAYLAVIYDGDCPFCSRYVAHVRLRNVAQKLDYVNARDGGPLVEDARKKGFDLNEGMLVLVDGAYHHGAEAVHVLAMLSSPLGAFNRLNGQIFKSRFLSRLLYPVLRAGRNLSLRLLGRLRLPSHNH